MNILICPDKFKGSLQATEVCRCVAGAVRHILPDARIEEVPMADGGEGSLEIISRQTGGDFVTVEVNDPLFRKIKAEYLLKDQTAYVEMARASGLQLLGEKERNPRKTTTYGTGELIFHAMQSGAEKIFLLVGGSATNDAGMGMAKALGFGFSDESGNELKATGENMINVKHIRNSSLLFDKTEFFVLCDVENPLYGKNGASYIFAKQKGADETAIEELDKGLQHISGLFKAAFNRDVGRMPGSGAAGGIAGGAVAFLGAEIRSGIHTLMEICELEEKISNADLIITGEGKIDSQTLNGKVIYGISEMASKYDKTLIAFCGKLDLSEEEVMLTGLKAVFPVKHEGMTEEEAMSNTGEKLLKLAIEKLPRFLK